MKKLHRAHPTLLLLVILAVATALRVWHISTWSLWEDEENTIYFSQNLRKMGDSYPLFFIVLGSLFRITDISVSAGRMLAAFSGLFSIWFTFFLVRRYVSETVAPVAAALLAVNLGHLFWSQSIRYYTMLLAFQILCMYCFLEGFERGKYRMLVWANLAFAGALLTHFSAPLLAPVLLGYLALMIWRGESAGGYNVKGYLIFGVPFVTLLAFFAGRMIQVQGIQAAFFTPSARDPLHVLVTVVAYYGVPAVALGLLAPLVAPKIPQRSLIFFVVAAVTPILELVVIARLNVMNATWYYALFALIGFVTLAGTCLVAVYQRSRQWGAALAMATGLYYLVFLAGYHTTMHGDRPRWAEATAFLQQVGGAKLNGKTSAEIYATEPGVVAFYLGVDPAQTMGTSLVRSMPEHPPIQGEAGDQWYLVKASHVSTEYVVWFAQYCALRARFPAQTGPVDRSVLVYFCPQLPPI